MRFKLLLAAFLLFGCSNSQDPGAAQNLSLAIGDTSCLDGAGPKIQNYFSGDQNDLHSVWTCATQILTAFSQFTEGARPDGYTAAELQGFLSKYYFQTGISIDMINSTLKLKQALVGGAGDFVTRGEIQLLLQALGVLDAAGDELFPAVKNLFTDADLTAPESDWLNAYQTFNDVLGRISTVMENSGSTYAFADLSSLLQAWAVQLDLPQTSFVYSLSKWEPILASGKAILTGGSAASVSPQEWRPFFSSVVSIYSYDRMFLRISPSGDLSAVLAGARLPWLVQGVVGLLKTAVERRTNSQIGLSEIQSFLTALQGSSFFPTSFTAVQLTSAVQFLLNRVFFVSGAAVDTLNSGTVSKMQSFLQNWNAYDAALVSHNFSQTVEFGSAVNPAGIPLNLDGQGRLLLPAAGSGVFHEYSAMFAVVEWIGEQWGTWPLSQAAFNSTVTDWLTLLHTLNYLTSTTASVSSSLMQEADLFMMSSDGALDLEKAEAFQYALYALSSYRGTRVLNSLTTACNGANPCVESGLANNLGVVLANFPNLTSWLKASPARWTALSQTLVTVAGADQWIKQFIVIHYIETYMARFDRNGDQMIDLNESLTAFPIFKPTLDVILPGQGLSAADDEPIYTYLFKYGSPPSGFSGDLNYYSWKSSPSSWSYNSDRSLIAQILNSLGSF